VEILEDTVVRRDEDVVFAGLGEESVMLNVATGSYHGLSDVGTRIWELLEAPHSAAGLTQELIEEFDVDAAVCRAAVIDFLRALADRRLVHVAG
jgi:hypothetical protein